MYRSRRRWSFGPRRCGRKARMRPLFTQERVAASAGLFFDGLLGEERRKTGWLRAAAAGDPGPWRQQAILGRGRLDADALRDIGREYAIERLAEPNAVAAPASELPSGRTAIRVNWVERDARTGFLYDSIRRVAFSSIYQPEPQRWRRILHIARFSWIASHCRITDLTLGLIITSAPRGCRSERIRYCSTLCQLRI